MLRVKFNSSALGPYTVSPDSIDLDKLDQTLERSRSQGDGVTYEYSLDLSFTKGAKDYLKKAYAQAGGIEAAVEVTIEEYNPNTFKWEELGVGKVKFTNREVDAEKFKTSIEQTGFERNVLNLLDVDVDLETLVSENGGALPAIESITLPLHSKTILLKFRGEPVPETVESPEIVTDALVTYYFAVPVTPSLNEIARYYGENYGLGPSFEEPTSISKYDFKIETAGSHEIKINRLLHQFTVLPAGLAGDDYTITRKVKFIYGKPGDYTSEDLYSETDVFTGLDPIITEINLSGITRTVDLTIDDEVYIFVEITVDLDALFFLYDYIAQNFLDSAPELKTDLEINSASTYPATTTKAYLIFEALQKAVQFYTNELDPFKSDFFGRTENGYAADGPGSLVALAGGRAIRKLENDTTFVNLQEIYNTSLRPVFCLGLGFQTIAGALKVVIEPLSYFYNKDSLILDLGVVSKFKVRNNLKGYYNTVEAGFAKLDIQQTNAIDEFLTLRRFKDALTQISAKLTITSKYKASGYEIESQRRQIGSTKDSKLDEANFLISVIRDGLGYLAKRTEGYTTVSNLFDADTVYNLDFSPARIVRNWGQVLAASLISITNKVLAFTSGEGNYFLTTRKTDELVDVVENGPVDLSAAEPLWENDIHTFEKPLTRDQMAIIRANPYGYFIYREIEGGPQLEGYLLKVARDSGKKLGTFETLKVYRKTTA
jgi:hypothetical protein